MSVKQPRTRKFMAHEPGFTIIDAMNRLFPAWFDGESCWDAWRVILKAAFALPMTKDEVAFYRTIAHGARAIERDQARRAPDLGHDFAHMRCLHPMTSLTSSRCLPIRRPARTGQSATAGTVGKSGRSSSGPGIH